MAHEITLYVTDTTVPQTITGTERLSDIGLTEAQRVSETAKPFWR